ncbi:MAG: DUF2752 domain-containing protein [Ruminococcaceae bacterium]|nr:DUF2752 domain-containing protein [Oscillospiraceae bacterium]
MNSKAKKTMLVLHLAVFAAILLFPIYRLLAAWGRNFLPTLMSGCFLHDWLMLYCPLCGGTRAAAALLRLDFAEALRSNALVVASVPIAAVLYVRAWVRLRRGEEKLFAVPHWTWITAVTALAVFGILRNLLMIFCAFDPLGDLLWFWNGI